mmetsp:Transcript_33769/g.46757  ORF Transcript_33769/g.46757 Transcript_33769/m.46757 type:complete len:170 (+) Transcript_33769:69-578(+)
MSNKSNPSRARKDEDEEEDKKGINWLPIIFLVLMIGPACLPVVEYLATYISGPPPQRNPHRARLEAFYARHNPAKLEDKQGMDQVLRKYRGNERLLFENLEKKYEVDSKAEKYATTFDFTKLASSQAIISLTGIGLVVTYFGYRYISQKNSKSKRRNKKSKISEVAKVE